MPEPGTAPPGTLYVVATPLGNLDDVSARALRVLREVALVACEDTRHTRTLLRAHGISTPTTSYFEHNERWKGQELVAALRAGRDVALVCDAGTPAISDPGFRLVREARADGITVLPVPGPSALAAALSVSGLPTDRVLFVGFLPQRQGPRRKALATLAGERATLVFFESPLRVVAALDDMLEALGEREAFLCREATTLHEEYVREPLTSLRERLAARGRVRGEIVLVVQGASRSAEAAQDPVALYRALAAEGRTRREAVKEVARRLGRHARDVYALVQAAGPEPTPPPER